MPNNQMTPQEISECKEALEILRTSRLTEKYAKGILTALNLIQEYEELKKKPICLACGGLIPKKDNEYNCHCVLAKYKLQNKKLEEELAWWHRLVKREVSGKFPNLQEYVKSLQSQLSALKEEKTCEHDWQAEWVKSYTTSSGGTKMRCKKCLEVRWIYD